MKNIEDFIFENCTGMKTLEINADTMEMGKGVFRGCSQLQTANLSRCNIKHLPDSTFENCTALEHITLAPSVTSIGHSAFSGCQALRSIQLGENLEHIGFEAFRDNGALSTIHIPISVTIIGNDAFAGCTALTNVKISRHFEKDISRIFGNIDRNIVHYHDGVDENLATMERILRFPKAPTEQPAIDDALSDQAVEVFLATGKASASILQRRLNLGFGRAARTVDRLEELGILGPYQSAGRDLLIDRQTWEAMGKTVSRKT